jgi:hypothetical protein
MVIPLPPERLAEAQQELRAQFASAPAVEANLRNAIHLDEVETLYFGEQRFRVQPVSGMEGLRLAELVDEYNQAASRGVAAFRRAHTDLVDYLWRLTCPRGFAGFVWRVLVKNPFRSATPQEVGDLLGFFGRRQTISRVRFRFQTAEADHTSTTGLN